MYEAALAVVCVFLLGGGLGLTLIAVCGSNVIEAEPYPLQYSLAPAAMFVLSLGVMGTYILMLAGHNLEGNERLGEKQCYVGFSLVCSCFLGMELLCHLAFT